MTRLLLFLVLVPIPTILFAQDLKSLAAKEIEQENYTLAVRYLERAVAAAPRDADAWYRLGHALHSILSAGCSAR